MFTNTIVNHNRFSNASGASIANADHVGAINILAAGYAVLACGEVGAVRPLDEAEIRKYAA